MPRLTEQEQQEIIRYIEADKPLPDKYGRGPSVQHCFGSDVCRSRRAIGGLSVNQ